VKAAYLSLGACWQATQMVIESQLASAIVINLNNLILSAMSGRQDIMPSQIPTNPQDSACLVMLL